MRNFDNYYKELYEDMVDDLSAFKRTCAEQAERIKILEALVSSLQESLAKSEELSNKRADKIQELSNKIHTNGN